MSEVASNPPLSSYYAALIGSLTGWSERALHLAFLIPALIVVLGTYRLAKRFTTYPSLAAVAALFTPVFLVSASTVMCDTMMLALWVLGTILWIEGLDPLKPAYLFLSTLTLLACILTKYFGVCSIILVLVYSFLRTKKLYRVIWYFLIPIVIVIVYNFWVRTSSKGSLLLSIAHYAIRTQEHSNLSFLSKGIVGLIFAGGCILPSLTYLPVLFSRLQIITGALICALIGIAIAQHWLDLGYLGRQHTTLLSIEAAIYLAGGLSIVAVAMRDVWQHSYVNALGSAKGVDAHRRTSEEVVKPLSGALTTSRVLRAFVNRWRWRRFDSNSIVLVLWVIGTLIFASFVNWTNNGRSILPAVPAAAILLVRQLESRFERSNRSSARGLLVAGMMPLIISGVFSLWIVAADCANANSQRQTAESISQQLQPGARNVWFEGHWGFQYYMQSLGAQPLHRGVTVHSGDYLVFPGNNTGLFNIPSNLLSPMASMNVHPNLLMTTHNPELGASFYASVQGPLPFALGPVPQDTYLITKVIQPFKVGH